MLAGKNKWLSIFDFDETLILSENHQVVVRHSNNTETTITPDKWTHYVPKQGDIFDFSRFEDLTNPKKNTKVWNIFTARLAQPKTHDVFVLSARDYMLPLLKFFIGENLSPNVVCLGIPPGDNNGNHKARWIEEEIHKKKYSFVEFYDDRDDCVSAVKKLRKQHEKTTFKITKVNKEILTEI